MKKIRKRSKKPEYNVYLLISLVIIFLTILFLKFFSSRINPKLVRIAKDYASQKIYAEISTSINETILKEDLSSLLNLSKNNSGEIINAEFNLNRSYEILSKVTKQLSQEIDFDKGDQGIVIKIPLGRASKYGLINNLGPQIPLNIKYIGTTITNLKTKITNYGLNNALLEIYLNLKITESIITPVNKEPFSNDYKILLYSGIINGRVPVLYGKSYELESKLFNVSDN